MKPIIQVSNLNFSYDQVNVLEGINLEIEDEEFFGIIGPNAGGKSTLVKLIMGLYQPDSGNISIAGKSPKAARSAIGYVPQSPSFMFNFPITVLEVVMLGRMGIDSSFGGFNKMDRELAFKSLATVELDNLANKQINTLSGGQVQKMLIARALACEPEILILDEPTANIDLQAEENIFALLKKYNEHMTIIVVSHDIAFISGYVHRVGCLNKTLVCHETESISGKTIEELYGANINIIHHSH